MTRNIDTKAYANTLRSVVERLQTRQDAVRNAVEGTYLPHEDVLRISNQASFREGQIRAFSNVIKAFDDFHAGDPS